jgi:hypothetical protein
MKQYIVPFYRINKDTMNKKKKRKILNPCISEMVPNSMPLG